MAELKVCVSLESTTVDEMVDEAARANLSGADMVEIRFDRLWLDKPEPEIVEEQELLVDSSDSEGEQPAPTRLIPIARRAPSNDDSSDSTDHDSDDLLGDGGDGF